MNPTEHRTIGALFLMLLALTTTRVSSNNAVKTGIAPAANVVVEEPEFTDVIENVTVPAGRNVKLACSVKNLGSFKVAWMHFEQSAILTVHNHVITRNPRISVTHDKHDKHKTWFLHISNVQEEDKGRYMCQINTVTAKTQFGYLHVVVPPNIDDSLSSSDVIVREGSNVTLKCRATGSPQPQVKWKRDDNSKIAINKSLSVLEWDGESVELSKISRLDMGAYLCIASNGVPPTVSKRIKVSVDFPPMLWIPHQLVGVPLNYNITLECFTEAHPTSLNYWTREDGHMIHDSRKYRTESTVGMPIYKTHMRLHIFNIQQSDYGTYKCVAKNPRGETDGAIRIYTSTPPTTSPGPPTTDSQLHDFWPGNGRNDSYGLYHPGNGPGGTHSGGQHHPNSYSVHVVDKNSKYSSSLNEVDKSEQKSFDSNVIHWSTGSSRDSSRTTLNILSSIVCSTLLPLLVRLSAH
ncbi:lachesin-like [Aedes albopictus]|uniref:Ig-like domain-containing protein n=1 Tax=Aedes albopictus TaxID=7160 RepID=A0ABM1Y5L2_AEDAL|nr:lachesin-like [Aedes albopictus]XP_029724947.1 lachesin-like [Aedes albopictus]